MAEPLGPDVGMEPECAVAAVASVHAAVPRPPARRETTTTAAAAAFRNRPAVFWPAKRNESRRSRIAAAATTPRTTITMRNHGSHEASRPRRTADQAELPRMTTARTILAGQYPRPRHSSTLPMP